MKIKKKLLAVFFAVLLVLPIFSVAAAGSYNLMKDGGANNLAQNAGYNTNNPKTVESYISQIIGIILSLLGVIFICLTIYAGITWMTAAGNEKKVEQAKELLTESVIGLVIVMFAYAITYFIIQQISQGSIKL